MREQRSAGAVCLAGAVAGFLFLSAQANAQTSTNFCISEHLKGSTTLGFAPSDASQLVNEIAISIGIRTPVTVVPCRFEEKASAIEHDGSYKGISTGQYVVYNPAWVREVIGSDRVQAIALFGHELGHLLNRHDTLQRNLSRLEKETQADEFAGCAVARSPDGTWEALSGLLSRLRADQSQDKLYPDRLKSLEAAERGFTKCGGVRQAPAGPDAIDQISGAGDGTKGSNPNVALQDLDRAIAVQPTSPEASFNRGVFYYRRATRSNAAEKARNLERAIQDFDRAISLRPNYLEALLARGKAHYLRGSSVSDYDRATKDFAMARILGPETASKVIGADGHRAVLGKAKLLLAVHEFDSAISELNSIGRTGIEGGTLQVLSAMAYAGKRDCDKASNESHWFFMYKEDAANDAEYLKELEKELEYHVIVGNCYLSRHDHDKAVDFYSTAIEILGLGPDLDVYSRSAEMKARDAQIGEKVQPSIKANLFHRRGTAFRVARQYDKAVPDFERALQLNPGNADISSGLAEAKRLRDLSANRK